jgi:hypothetical protein
MRYMGDTLEDIPCEANTVMIQVGYPYKLFPQNFILRCPLVYLVLPPCQHTPFPVLFPFRCVMLAVMRVIYCKRV